MPDTLTSQPALIVFREKDDKSLEAGWFTEADAGRAKADRSKPGLTTLENLSDRVRDFAVHLPTGCFEADGKLLLGVTDRATIDQLLALRAEERKAGAMEGQARPGQSKPAQPAATKITEPKAPSRGEAGATARPSSSGSKGVSNGQEKVRPSPTTAELVDTLWSKITIGSVVIAPEADRTEEGWWEAVVTEKRGQVLTLRWRDFPRQRPITRKLSEVALAHPKSGV
jgi:hypothetical protein